MVIRAAAIPVHFSNPLFMCRSRKKTSVATSETEVTSHSSSVRSWKSSLQPLAPLGEVFVGYLICLPENDAFTNLFEARFRRRRPVRRPTSSKIVHVVHGFRR